MRIFEVVCEGIYCLTITVHEEQDAHAEACRALGLDDDDGAVEIYQVFE